MKGVVECDLLGEGIAQGIFEVVPVPKAVLDDNTDLFGVLDDVEGRRVPRNNKYFRRYIYISFSKIAIKALRKMWCKYWVLSKILWRTLRNNVLQQYFSSF